MKTQSLHNQLVELRHDLHMHPQLSFEEEYAAAKVSTLLKEFGIEVHSGIARTGVVGILKKGNSSKSIGIRIASEYNNFTESIFFQPLFEWTPNPFTIFYLGGNQNLEKELNYYTDRSQFFIKFQYLISI